jgi:DNA-binding XRE family transcriptional regulator
MKAAKKAALEAAGFKVGDIDEFLGLSDHEMRVVEFRVAAARAVRELRKSREMSQAELAALVETTQSRIAKIEAGVPGVSLDQVMRALFALGGSVALVHPGAGGKKPRRKAPVGRG